MLVALLIGTFGFIVWHNRANDKSVTSNSALRGYLTLDDWKVKFKLADSVSVDQVTHYKITNSGVAYGFSTKRVEALGADCLPTASRGLTPGLVTISRFSQTPRNLPPTAVLIKQFSDYNYYLTTVVADCSAGSKDIQSQDRDMIVKLLGGIEAL